MKSIKLLALLLVAGVLVTACTQNTVTETTADDSMMIEDEAKMENENEALMEGEDGEAVVDSMQKDETVVKLTAENFTFGADEIKISKGSKLIVEVTNASGMHDFVIDELEVNSGIIPEGETMQIEVPTDTAGEFEYYCSVGSHREMGMKGTLIVE